MSETTKQSPFSKKGPTKYEANQNSRIRKIIGVVSGKGGVGKSTVTSLLACASARAGYHTAILDADITGPSIPACFGLSGLLYSTEENFILPAYTAQGIKVVSTNLILEDEEAPVIWRASILNGVIKQFFTETDWGEVDYMFVDLPPGTSDIPLTIMQSMPLDGIIIVSTPQGLVRLIVEKAINMARMMNVKIIGLVENMSYVECDNCGNRTYLFGSSRAEEVCELHNIPLLARLPINPALSTVIDAGRIEEYPVSYLDEAFAAVEKFGK